MAVFYHITDPARKTSILRHGLRAPAWLSRAEDLDDWLVRYLSDRFILGKRVSAGLFRAHIPWDWVCKHNFDQEAVQYVCKRLITPGRLSYLAVDIATFDARQTSVYDKGGRVQPLLEMAGAGYTGERAFARDLT